MNRLAPALIGSLLAALALAVGGCEKESNKQSDAGLGLGASEAAAQAIPAKTFQEDIQALTANPHRLAGYADGSLAAGRYVEGRLRGIQGAEVFIQSFPLVQPVTTECRLLVDGQEVQAERGRAIYQVRPNLLIASITPPEGIRGSTVYARDGEMASFGNQSPKDKIVVLDYNCERNWMNAFALGARAVVFIGAEAPAPMSVLHVNLPANLPRFYVTREIADRLELTKRSRELTIQAATEWRQLQGRSVIAVLRGTDANFAKDSDKDKPQAVVLAAPLDSLSEVPELSSGARDAGNCAALLQIAQRLAADRPKRDTVLCFFDGQTLNNLGARAFYGAMCADPEIGTKTARKLDERMKMLEQEALFRRAAIEIFRGVQEGKDFKSGTAESLAAKRRDAFQAKLAQLPGDDPGRVALQQEIASLDAVIPVLKEKYNDCLQLLKNQAEVLSGNCLEPLRNIRLQVNDLRVDAERKEGQAKEIEKKDPQKAKLLRQQAAEERNRVEELTAKSLRPLEAEDEAWNGVQRSLNREKYDGNQASWIDLLARRGIDACGERLEELRLQAVRLRESMALRNAIGKEHNRIALHLGVNLGDAREQWCFIHGDDATPGGQADPPALYAGLFATIREIGESLRKEAPTFDGRSAMLDYEVRWFAPAKFADSGDIARIFAVNNLSIMTMLDRMVRQGQPLDTLANLNQQAMSSQADQVQAFLRKLLDHPEMGYGGQLTEVAWFNEIVWSGDKPQGPVVVTAGAGSAMANKPVGSAVVAMTTGGWPAAVESEIPGFQTPLIVHTNRNGNFEFLPVSQSYYAQPFLFTASFDPARAVTDTEAKLDFADAVNIRGLPRAVSHSGTIKPGKNEKNISITLARVKVKTVVGYGFSTPLVTLAMPGAAAVAFPKDKHLLCEWKNIITVFAPEQVKAVKFFNAGGVIVLNNDSTEKGYQGVGLPLDDPFEHPVTTLSTAHDLLAVDDYRLAMLRGVGITQESLEILSGKARDLLENAAQIAREAVSGAATKPAAAEETAHAAGSTRPAGEETFAVQREVGAESASAVYSRNAYGPLVEVINDLVTAVVLLLLLAMPFAYALERLLIGTPHIYRQIGWFAVFFLVTFGLLYVVNPAFRIAATPIIIFLAFTIILLSSLVIFIMIRKLQSEIKKIQGLGTTVHSADVSRLSTMMAAVNMGISTMRRRPVRTLLTAVTVVLLTFTILTFASFGASWGLRETYSGPMNTNAPQLLVRHQLWSPLDEGLADRLQDFLLDEAVVVPRRWVSATTKEAAALAKSGGTEPQMLLTTGDLKAITPVAAAIGLDIRDIQPAGARQNDLRDLLSGDIDRLATDGIFLTAAQRKGLGLGAEDQGKAAVYLAGVKFTYAGEVKDEMSAFTILDGSSALPVDYGSFSPEELETLTSTVAGQAQQAESARFSPYSVDKVVVVPAAAAKRLGGQIRSLSIYPHRGAEQMRKLANDVAFTCELPTYVGQPGKGVQRLLFTSLAEASGWRDLLIPVILGGLIVFATMLGSVSDREREIYTFSSLGLAPPHIASLFFAEASMYAVVGGMGGYLLGQVVTRLLRLLSDAGLVSVPPMNYSSTNAIVTIAIVMCTVLISTIYPAMKASRSANPGVQRAWKIPKPQNDLYDLVFPFTVSTYDIIGVASFLREHFDNYRDAALGIFATTQVRIFRQKGNDMLGLHATVALAPFDLGVTQNFTLLSQASEIEGIDEVRILIQRLSGAASDWQRSNRVFINDLRKQLLIWRSLTPQVMERYRGNTLEQWANLPVEDTAGSARLEASTVCSDGGAA